MTTLTVTHVSKSIGRTPILDDVSLSIASGTRTAVVGASGSGKTSLLRLVAGFERPDSGEIHLGSVTLATADVFVAAHRRGIGYVAQDGALFPHLTVEENVRFGLPRGERHRRTDRVREMMELTSLDPALASRYPHELSGGQQQRVALARALAQRPQVVLLDEPFSALDTGLRDQTRRAVVAALEHSAVTTVLVTHDHDEALSFGHQIAVIADGRIVQSGAPDDVFASPVTPAVAAFLGAAVVLPATAGDGYADCPLGRIVVRHDRRDDAFDAPAARALLRPAQLRLSRNGEPPNATVEGLRPRGSHVEVIVRPDAAHDLTIPLRVPAHECTGYDVGTPVSISVAGGCVLYPDDGSRIP